MKTDTAHAAWNTRWSTETGRADWLTPDPDVAAVAERLADGTARTALDLGSGVGRHSLLLARAGIAVTAVDLAQSGLAEIARRARSEGLAITTQAAPMTALPFADAAFDYALAWNVIYHGDGEVVGRTMAEVRRVLKPGGLLQATMLSKRNAGYGIGREVAPNTFSRDPSPDDPNDMDKAHPHFYCSASELVSLLAGFELTSLTDVEQRKPGAWHWQFVAERVGPAQTA